MLACLLSPTAVALGCGGGSPTGPSRAALDGGTDGTDAAPRHADAQTDRDAAPLCDALHIPGRTDAAARAHGDAGATPSPNDAGEPPPDCLAPCVWDLVKDCLPPGPCTSQAYEPYSIASYDDLICAPGTGWAATRHSSSFHVYGHSVSVYVDDALCYGTSTGQMDGVFGLYALSWWSGKGRTTAMIGGRTGAGVPGLVGSTPWGPVACGTPAALTARARCLAAGDCPDGGDGVTVYDVDPDQPRCAPWRAVAYAAYGIFSCTPGCCP